MQAVGKQLYAWLFQLRGPERGEIVLVQRRIFILPTRAGVGFALVLMLMLAGSINYNLSLGYALTFLLGSVGFSAMLHTFRNLAGLRIKAARTGPVFAGETARFAVCLQNPTATQRFSLALARKDSEPDVFDIAGEASVIATARVPSTRRGLLSAGRLTLYTRFPVGLYHAWAYVELDEHCVIYPRAAPPGLPLPPLAGSSGEAGGRDNGREDFAGLRPYHPGDSSRHIAWKAVARDGILLTKQFTGHAASELWLSLDLAPEPLDVEGKLSCLTRWILDAHANGIAYGLKIPGTVIAIGRGELHRDRCLEALALL
ncbi:MAG TPA: DUF58 domain-containing protein [Burkholderiales bacterium]|jgi:uncharacterized protein (DUF58 family)|nr:DUF58 domain-containing protein [Burkholderiales bacterium]